MRVSGIDIAAQSTSPSFLREVRRSAQQAKQEMQAYLLDQTDKYQVRRLTLDQHELPVIAWCGWGRVGKDEAGQWLGNNSDLLYPGGGCSLVALPLVAHALEMTEEKCYAERHQSRLFWFHFCNALREDDPTLLVRLVLARGDTVTGIRGGGELRAAVAAGLIDHTVWIHKPGVSLDPTVEYDELDCQHAVINAGTLPEYHAKLRKLCETKLRIPFHKE